MLIRSFCETQSKKWRNAGLEKRKIGEDRKLVIGEYFKDCPEGTVLRVLSSLNMAYSGNSSVT